MKVKWGVLGSTGIAFRRTIPEGIVPAKNAQLAAVYSPTRDRNQAVAEQFSARACSSQEELFASGCEVVYVASPNYLHCDQVIAAARAGLHVFCEKPLGVSVDEAERMVEACRKAGVKLGVGLMMRFHSYHQEALRLIRQGRIGQPVLGRAQLSCWYPPIEGAWRQEPAKGGGGTLPDLASHCIDLLEMFFGPTKRLACFVDNLIHNYPSEDTATVMLEFENGVKGFVDCLFNIPDQSCRNQLELYGTKGSIRAEGTLGQGEAGKMSGCFQEDSKKYDSKQSRCRERDLLISPDPRNTYRAEIEAFSQCVIDDSQPPVGAEDGLWSQRVIAACYESARTGRTVRT